MIPALERKPAGDSSRLLAWTELGGEDASAAHIMLAPIAGRGEESKALNSWIRSIERAKQAAERKRLFYVACTRARQDLHLFASPELTATGEVKPQNNSLLSAAWPAAEADVSELPLGGSAAAENVGLSIAAEQAQPLALLERLPLAFDPEARFEQARKEWPAHEIAVPAPIAAERIARPEGSLAARALGSVIHSGLEMCAAARAAGTLPSDLLQSVATWRPRMVALLRAKGVAPGVLDRLARDAVAMIGAALQDADGLWVLDAHPSGATEFALVAWPDVAEDAEVAPRPASIRVDRMFCAGPEPHSPGEDFLWIVDYKTTKPTGADEQASLENERLAYAPQLENYAHLMTQARGFPLERIRLALYFPAIPRLIWWKADESGARS
jgi:ATP-dependent helicase/nuclease subunit A